MKSSAAAISDSRKKAKAFLESVKLASVWPGRSVISVETTTPLPDVFNTLVKNDILCVPVINSKSRKPVGLVDMMDIVAFLVSISDKTKLIGGVAKLMKQDDIFYKAVSLQISDISMRNSYYPVKVTDNLWTACKAMVDNVAHRVPVEDDEGKLVGFITQSEILGYLNDGLSKLGPIVSSSLDDLGMGVTSKTIIAGRMKDTALEVFSQMSNFGFSALPIVDDKGKLLTILSAKDIRAIASGDHLFDNLHLSVVDYFRKAHEKDADIKSPAISCAKADTIETVIKKIWASKIHRIYVVTDDSKPINVVSLHDILSLFVA